MKTFINSLKYLFYTQKRKQAVLNKLKIESAILRLKLVAPLTEDDLNYILYHAKRIESVSKCWNMSDILWLVEGSLMYTGDIEYVKKQLNEGWR